VTVQAFAGSKPVPVTVRATYMDKQPANRGRDPAWLEAPNVIIDAPVDLTLTPASARQLAEAPCRVSPTRWNPSRPHRSGRRHPDASHHPTQACRREAGQQAPRSVDRAADEAGWFGPCHIVSAARTLGTNSGPTSPVRNSGQRARGGPKQHQRGAVPPASPHRPTQERNPSPGRLSRAPRPPGEYGNRGVTRRGGIGPKSAAPVLV